MFGVLVGILVLVGWSFEGRVERFGSFDIRGLQGLVVGWAVCIPLRNKRTCTFTLIPRSLRSGLRSVVTASSVCRPLHFTFSFRAMNWRK